MMIAHDAPCEHHLGAKAPPPADGSMCCGAVGVGDARPPMSIPCKAELPNSKP
jgi:hypothetical protein